MHRTQALPRQVEGVPRGTGAEQAVSGSWSEGTGAGARFGERQVAVRSLREMAGIDSSESDPETSTRLCARLDRSRPGERAARGAPRAHTGCVTRDEKNQKPMEGSGVRARQRARTQRTPSRNKTLRSSEEAAGLEAEEANPERKLMSVTPSREHSARSQRREGTAQQSATSVVRARGPEVRRDEGSSTVDTRAQAEVEAAARNS